MRTTQHKIWRATSIGAVVVLGAAGVAACGSDDDLEDIDDVDIDNPIEDVEIDEDPIEVEDEPVTT